jgi:hypothetical protein
MDFLAARAAADRDLLSLSAKTRILQTQISTNRMRTLMIYLYLTGVHPTSVHLMGGYLVGVYLLERQAPGHVTTLMQDTLSDIISLQFKKCLV